MLTSDFDYHLPPELIAQIPAEPRDGARLMVVDRAKQTRQHRHFFELGEYLRAGDLLVWNNSKVFRARLFGKLMLDAESDDIDDAQEVKRHPTGKILPVRTVEVLLARPLENKHVWKVLAKPARRLRLGMKIKFADDLVGEILLKADDGTVLLQFADDDLVVRAKANKYGEVPTPPYIDIDHSRLMGAELAERYQTVYAKHEGSVAAPTAGFHFTPALIEKLTGQGVQFAEVTLHVGLGTFQPVKTERVEDHVMHSEWAELSAKNADLINAAKAEGRRVVAVGTTTVRTLEGIARAWTSDLGLQTSNTTPDRSPKTEVRPFDGDINIFITPGFQFQIVDALITNFHLPKSTLLMLVSAFAGDTKFMLECYQEAIRQGYRFYSFGDAMLIQ
ncbi:MAG: tRNA preQ1(34) S-adenosylmethionine ribosyltransferase-isomerase QueA [Candidatus Magasanikbacteria bacterium]|nr:tRNA preQ1(34) S-adenosylmethionine ribosyltransferase-isomerase QueA [Candidatus Magasanikbacteria bacterium]